MESETIQPQKSANTNRFPSLFDKKVLIVLGSGGVGKTTIASSIALKMSMSGKKTLVLTIDPSKRLADTLSIDKNSPEEQMVQCPFTKNLFATLLQNKPILDTLISNVIPDQNLKKLLFSNKYYLKLTYSLIGIENYLVIFKLEELLKQNRYEAIILDTPPQFYTFEFLKAPLNLLNFMAIPYLKDMSRFLKKKSFMKLSRIVMWGLSKFLGKQFLSDLIELTNIFIKILFYLQDKVTYVHTLLESKDVGFILILNPTESSIKEGEHIVRRFEEEGREIHGIILNKSHHIDDGKNSFRDSFQRAFSQFEHEVTWGNPFFYPSFAQKVTLYLSIFEHLSQKEDTILTHSFLKDRIHYRIKDFDSDVSKIEDLEKIAYYFT